MCVPALGHVMQLPLSAPLKHCVFRGYASSHAVWDACKVQILSSHVSGSRMRPRSLDLYRTPRALLTWGTLGPRLEMCLLSH